MAVNYTWHHEIADIEFTLDLEKGLLQINGTSYQLYVERKHPYMYFEGFLTNKESRLVIDGNKLIKVSLTRQGLIFTTTNGNNQQSYLDQRYRKFKRTSSKKDWILVVKNQPKISYCN